MCNFCTKLLLMPIWRNPRLINFLVILHAKFDARTLYANSKTIEHIINILDWFTSLTPILKGLWSILVAYDCTLWVKGQGKIEIIISVFNQHKWSLPQKVWYALDLWQNLFSIGQTSNKDLSLFSIKNCNEFFLNEGQGVIVLKGMCGKGKFYKLCIIMVKPLSQINHVSSMISTWKEKFQLWLERMGHVSVSTIKWMHEHLA